MWGEAKRRSVRTIPSPGGHIQTVSVWALKLCGSALRLTKVRLEGSPRKSNTGTKSALFLSLVCRFTLLDKLHFVYAALEAPHWKRGDLVCPIWGRSLTWKAQGHVKRLPDAVWA